MVAKYTFLSPGWFWSECLIRATEKQTRTQELVTDESREEGVSGISQKHHYKYKRGRAVARKSTQCSCKRLCDSGCHSDTCVVQKPVVAASASAASKNIHLGCDCLSFLLMTNFLSYILLMKPFFKPYQGSYSKQTMCSILNTMSQ